MDSGELKAGAACAMKTRALIKLCTPIHSLLAFDVNTKRLDALKPSSTAFEINRHCRGFLFHMQATISLQAQERFTFLHKPW